MNAKDQDDEKPIEGTASGTSATRSGRRRDGKPFAESNIREDGDYRVGKNRPPEHGQFRAGDGRRRGRRPKGQRNFDQDWEDELGRTVQLTRDGRTLRVSAHRAQVMTAMSLAAKGRERSQELVFRKARELADLRQTFHSQSDDALIAEWLAQTGQTKAPDDITILGDDNPGTPNDLATSSGDSKTFSEERDDDPE